MKRLRAYKGEVRRMMMQLLVPDGAKICQIWRQRRVLGIEVGVVLNWVSSVSRQRGAEDGSVSGKRIKFWPEYFKDEEVGG